MKAALVNLRKRCASAGRDPAGASRGRTRARTFMNACALISLNAGGSRDRNCASTRRGPPTGGPQPPEGSPDAAGRGGSGNPGGPARFPCCAGVRADLLDVTRMRQELESMAMRMSVEHGGDEWEAALLAAFHRLSKVKKVFVTASPRPAKPHHQSGVGIPPSQFPPFPGGGLRLSLAVALSWAAVRSIRSIPSAFDPVPALIRVPTSMSIGSLWRRRSRTTPSEAVELIRRHIGDTTAVLLAADSSVYGE